jgi:predicted Zn finger-like uncharacterized protein
VVQREVAATSGDGGPQRACPNCRAPLRVSHRRYAGAGSSTVVLRCSACGHTLTGATRSDAERTGTNRGRSRRHQPVDEGPPTNPVIDSELARRLLEEMGA